MALKNAWSGLRSGLQGVSTYYKSIPRGVKGGIPLFLLVLGGSYMFSIFQQVGYSYNKRRGHQCDRGTMEKFGIKMRDKEDVSLEKIFEEVQEIDTDNWEQIRGPRPYEEGNVMWESAVERGRVVDERTIQKKENISSGKSNIIT